MKLWHEELAGRSRYGLVERFNHTFPVKHSPTEFRTTLEIGAAGLPLGDLEVDGERFAVAAAGQGLPRRETSLSQEVQGSGTDYLRRHEAV